MCCYTVRQEFGNRFSGAVEGSTRKIASSSGLRGDNSRLRSSEGVPSSKDVVVNHFSSFWGPINFSKCLCLLCFQSDKSILLILQQMDSERGRVSRATSASKRPVLSGSRPSSSGEPSDTRHSRLGGSGRVSTTQRLQPGFESKSSSFTRAAATRGSGIRHETLRSFELLTIATGKRK